MTVTKEVERLEHSAVKMTLKVSKEDLRSEYDKIVGNYAKTIQIPGFRKGKVPRDILVRKFADVFTGETLANVMDQAVTETFKEESLSKEDRPLPYSTPELKDEPPKLDLEKDLEFSMLYDTFPQFTVGKWQGLEVEAPDVSIEDEDIGRELEIIRERNAIVLDRDDGALSVKGDVVTVDYAELSEDGQIIPGTERQDFVFTLGSENNIFYFDDEVAGMKKGETRDITKTYPGDFKNKDLAGQARSIRVTVTAVKKRKLPDLDDDLSQDVDEKYQTLDDLKADVRGRLCKQLEQRLRGIKINNMLEKVLETTPIDVPESMIRIELDGRWRNMARQLGSNPEDLARSLENSGSGTREAILEGWRGDAVKALKSRLIVESLITERNLDASDEEMEKEFETLAAGSDTSIEDIKKYYESENMKQYFKEEIKERKFFDLLLSENTVKTGEKKKYLDLISNNQ
ncbi:MAG: trigger factor [Spirochaetaceae bacterium]|nr:trigger factor [Spirochaetaceae bacterium]